jgi:hypothetical protein
MPFSAAFLQDILTDCISRLTRISAFFPLPITIHLLPAVFQSLHDHLQS